MNWKVLVLYVLLIPLIITTVAGFWFLAEDSIILYSKNKMEKCMKSLLIIARWNNTEEKILDCYNILGEMESKGLKLRKENPSIK